MDDRIPPGAYNKHMTRYDHKIHELKNLLALNEKKLNQAFGSWAENTEELGSGLPEPSRELLDTCITTAQDIKREKANLSSVESLLSALTSVQTRKRDILQRRNLLIRSCGTTLQDLGEQSTAAYHRGEFPWINHPQLFSAADRYETRYKDLVQQKMLLDQTQEDKSFWKSLKRASSSLFNYLSLKRVDYRRKDVHTNLGVTLAEDLAFYDAINSLPLSETSVLQTFFEPLRTMKESRIALEAEEVVIKTQLETFGAQQSPARRLGELHRTLGVLQTRLMDLRIRRGKALWEAAALSTAPLSPQETPFFETIKPLLQERDLLSQDLVQYQSAADIQILEERNHRLGDKIRGYETQIRRLQGDIQVLQGEIENNQTHMEEKIPLKGNLE